MPGTRFSRRRILVAGSIMAAAGVSSTPFIARAAPAADAPQLQEVVVTAQRRSTNILKTPVAVSSISGSAIETRHLLNMSDLTTETPGVQFGTNHTNADITIRGIGNSTSTQGTDPGVAFHLDGVYLARSNLAASDLLDVDHVEVLRGPQGTLFGRNATGGAVNVISKAPTSDFESELGGWVGFDPTQAHIDGFVSGPFTADGTVEARVSARRDYNQGFTENLTAGGPSRLDNQDGYALRAQTLAKPNDHLTLGLDLDYAQERDNGRAVFITGAPGVTSTGGYVTISPAQVAAEDAAQDGVATPAIGDIATRKAQANQGSFDSEFFGVRASAEWRASAGTLKGLAAFDQTLADSNEDGDGTSLDYSNTVYNERAHQEYSELVWSSNISGPFDYLVGADVFDQTSRERVVVPVSYYHASVIIPSQMDTLSYAAFAHGDYQITPAAKLFAGVRYTRDEKSIAEVNNFAGAEDHAASWSSVTYEAGLSYQLTQQVNAYAKYATGFKSGGFQAGDLAPPFQPETDGSYEAGIKGRFLDNRLQADLTGFRMDYNNLQVNQIVNLASVVTNAAQAKIDGAELSAVALVTSALRVEVTGSYLDARFNKFLTVDSARPTLGQLNLAGNSLPNAPRFSYSLGAYYDLPISIPGKLTLGGRYYWKDKVYFSEFNLPVASQNAVGRGDVSLDYESADKRWQAGAFARNVGDARVISSLQVVSAVLNSAAIASLDPGREIGVSLRRRF